MSIQEHLNKIRNAVYGHEVRESIAKGIETAYDDASEKDNANMEVKIARGTHPTLRDRLNEVDNTQQQTTTQLQQTEQSLNAQLAEKADIADLPSSAYTFKGSTTFALLPTTGNTLGDVRWTTDNLLNYAWTGTAWTPIGNGAFANGTVTTIKIADEAVTTKKIEKTVPGKNLFDLSTATPGYLDPTTSSIIASASYKYSEEIDVTPGEPYAFSWVRTIFEYDGGVVAEVKSYSNTSVPLLYTPTYPKIRVSTHNNDVHICQVEKGEATAYEPYKKLIPLSIIEPFTIGTGEVYDQSLNTTDSVSFASIETDALYTSGFMPTGTLASPPSGLLSGDVWADTTDSTTHPISKGDGLMRWQGININGLKIFPQAEKELQPCTHKYGAVATWSHCTDTYKPTVVGHGWDAEIHAFKYNLPMTVFASPYSDGAYAAQLTDAINTGRITAGTYFVNWRWKNPITGTIENIPSFFDATWNQEACDKGLITQSLVGTTKTKNYPSLAQMYTLTNGLYGYDNTNNVMGSIDVVTDLINEQYEWLNTLVGRYPSSASYSYGINHLKTLLKNKYLGIRSSAQNLEEYDYIFNRDEAMDIPITTRYVDLSGTNAENSVTCVTALQNAVSTNGWYRDFCHWHNAVGDELSYFYESQRTAIGSSDVAVVDFGTAMEHKFLRDMVRRIHLFTKGDSIIISVDIKDDLSLPLQDIETPLSVEVDLSGTILEGKEIQGYGDKGIKKIVANRFIVEVPYSKKDGFYTVKLSETPTPEYLDFNVPIIQSTALSGGVLTVTTSKKTNIAIFKVATGGSLYQVELVKRSNIMSDTHLIDFSGIATSGFDFYIGAITETKQSNLSVPIAL